MDWNPTHEFWFYTEIKDKREDVEFLILTYKDNECLEPAIVESIESAGYNQETMMISLDPAVSEIFNNGKYELKKEGKVLPAEEEKVADFMLGLSEEQRTKYIEMLKANESKVDLKEVSEQKSKKEEKIADEYAVDFDEMSID